jgi:plastocyanin
VRSFGSVRGLVLVGALALALGACSSGNGDGSAGGAAPPASGDPASAGGCADAAGLAGAVEDRGTAEASGGAVTLDATEFAFSPTCVEAGGGRSLEVTVTNSGSALHNLSVGSLGIDEDVQAGEMITVEVTLPDSGAVPFVCKYHVANGMQGAFLTN